MERVLLLIDILLSYYGKLQGSNLLEQKMLDEFKEIYLWFLAQQTTVDLLLRGVWELFNSFLWLQKFLTNRALNILEK